MFMVAAFYKFVEIDDCESLHFRLAQQCCGLGIRGTILVAPEGLNATVSGTGDAIDALLATLRSQSRFADLAAKLSTCAAHPFQRMKVKIKPEIITLGDTEANPARHVGTYVAPSDWNALIRDPDVLVIDTRNAYETDIGTFEGAVAPQTATFGDFPAYVAENLDPRCHKRVAMFCTGGIRCEKASALLLTRGFAQVYHLKGGILDYLAQVPEDESLFRGECFVFDERVALKHGTDVGHHELCAACGYPIAAEVAAMLACPRCQTPAVAAPSAPGSEGR